jgi:glucosamine 6-phosphate synthetase-like amidotransferase/phosphosugar isomerase protein
MCGVIGLVYGRLRKDLGRIAADLLKTLEYRGYDSTGVAIQGDDQSVTLKKGVGAPSVMVDELGITQTPGRLLCGQVRWATFGAVDEVNAQPHVVRCKTHIYGAHNGNVTNCDDLKAWLVSEGHDVLSDNDGEMVVHTVEHYFALWLGSQPESKQQDATTRRECMRAAVVTAAAKLEGSYAAVVVDPVTRCAWAIKQGSSLYFGMGQDEEGDAFAIASSDLSAVLRLTHVLVPMAAGEFVEFDAEYHQIYRISDRRPKAADQPLSKAGEPLKRTPVRSRLRAKDIALSPRFSTFMDQEISAQEQTCRDVVTLFNGGTEASKMLLPYLEARPLLEVAEITVALDKLRDEYDDEVIRRDYHKLVDLPPFRALLEVPEEVKQRGTAGSVESIGDKLVSSEAPFFADLLPMARDRDDILAVRFMDALFERAEVAEFAQAIDRFAEMCCTAMARGGRLYVVCCGSSFHAAKAAALFFNQIAHTELAPILPGEFRGQYARGLRDGDLLIAVSQSGETKDLIDVLNYVIDTGLDIRRVGLVNNLNSTLAQEKSDLVIPLRCGPEIAVPATKSFINQMVLFYCLALRLAQRLAREQPAEVRSQGAAELSERLERLCSLPQLIRETFDSTDAEIAKAAQLLYLAPSIHLLATRISAVAKEGALKIREVVLNHTEGFEGSEFKHGPNTILGFNTLFGPQQVDTLLKNLGRLLGEITSTALARGMNADAVARLAQAATDSVFSLASTPFTLKGEERALLEQYLDRSAMIGELYADYPLIYITGPDEQDVALTVSAINTHKIRGASTVLIAEDHPALRQAAAKAPADNPAYRSVFIPLPRTGDTVMAVFSATVVLQRLALKASLLKAQYLTQLGLKNHGVHPDVPKNVSKSITVD